VNRGAPCHLETRLPSCPSSNEYLPMGNSCGSTATVPSEPQPAPPVTGLKPLQPNVREETPLPSFRPSSRPRSHSSASKHESAHHGRRSSQGSSTRSRTKSAPQPPQSFKSSSHQDPRPRARSVVQSKCSRRSDSRTTGPGEIYGKAGYEPLLITL